MFLCNKCNTELPKSSFYKCSSKPNGIHSICKDCNKKWREKYKAKTKKIPKSKFCTFCTKKLTSNKFHKSNMSKDGLCNKCILCSIEYKKSLEINIPETKFCKRCGKHKLSEHFSKSSQTKCGLHYCCKVCDSARKGIVYGERKVVAQPEHIRKIKKNVSSSIRNYMKSRGIVKGKTKTFSKLPYSAEQLYEHLIWTIKFLDGYNEDDFHTKKNNRAVLEIDHIKPHSHFRYETMDDDDFKSCWSLSNLRLLPYGENQRKHCKYDHEFHKFFIEQMELRK